MNGMYVLKVFKWLELGSLPVDADTGDCETAGPFGVSEAEMVCEPETTTIVNRTEVIREEKLN
jgi:hypothetical protein